MNSNHHEQGKCAVILTVDTKSYAIATIDLAVAMAASIQTRLHGLFIEDEDLLRVATLPFAREIAFPTASERTMDALGMQRSLRAMAGQFRKYLAQSAQTGKIQWSYDYVCGRVRDIGMKSDPNTIYTILGQSVFRRPESRHSLRRRKVLLIENSSPHIINALKVVLAHLNNKKIEVTLVRNRENTSISAASPNDLENLLTGLSHVSLVTLANNQLPQLLSCTGTTYDYVIVSRQEPPEILKKILDNSICPVILVS